MSFADDFSPAYIGSDTIKVSLSARTLVPTASKVVIFEIDYSGADSIGGVVLPLLLKVQAPTVAGYLEKLYERNLPSEVFYFPISGGKHLVTIAETGHNQVFGSMPFDVSGDQLSVAVPGRG